MKSFEEVKEELVLDYREKEKQQRRKADFFLSGIIICLIICLGIFLFANYLSENRTSTKSIINQKEVDLKAVVDTLTKVKDTINILSKNDETMLNDLNGYTQDTVSKEYKNLKLKKKKNGSHLNYLLQTKKFLTSQKLNLEDIISRNKYTPELFDFINITSTRIGAIFILIFLVQFLSRIYRYNLKLADFYGSRASALQLITIQNSSLTLIDIIGILSPDNIDVKFSKAPNDQLLELAKTAIDALTKVKSGN